MLLANACTTYCTILSWIFFFNGLFLPFILCLGEQFSQWSTSNSSKLTKKTQRNSIMLDIKTEVLQHLKMPSRKWLRVKTTLRLGWSPLTLKLRETIHRWMSCLRDESNHHLTMTTHFQRANARITLDCLYSVRAFISRNSSSKFNSKYVGTRW